METVIGLFKADCIRTTVCHHGPYRNLADVEWATAGWVEWWNSQCLHNSLRQQTGEKREKRPDWHVFPQAAIPGAAPPRPAPGSSDGQNRAERRSPG